MKAAKTVPGTRSVSFWCAEKDRMVTVEFVSHGSFLFRRETKILSCSVFEDPSLINCSRRCLDPANRRLTPDWQVLGY
jgi:hypothetical protein